MKEQLKEFGILILLLLSVMLGIHLFSDNEAEVQPVDEQGRSPLDEHYQHEHRFGEAC